MGILPLRCSATPVLKYLIELAQVFGRHEYIWYDEETWGQKIENKKDVLRGEMRYRRAKKTQGKE